MMGSATSQGALALVESAHAAAPVASGVVALRDLRAHCTSCAMRGLCLPHGLDAEAMRRFDALIGARMRVKRKDTLYRPGDRFSAVYPIRLGTFKTLALAEDGREQITGYHIAGEIIGLDGIGDDRYTSQAIALEDSEVCEIPFGEFERLGRELPPLQQHFHRIMSREIARDYGVMLLLGSMRAEERLAAFLVNLSVRYRGRGYSSIEFVLRMTREEIGSFLGLKLETVSRLFSRFQEEGLVQVQGRTVKIVDLPMLKRLAGAG